jgi:hypothetical protein
MKKAAVFLFSLTIRETREGTPLMTVETDENRDLSSTNERGPSLVGSLGSLLLQEIFILPRLL